MLFNSFQFLFFLTVIFLIYWLVPAKRFKIQNLLLLIGSYFFYGCWHWQFLSLLFISTLLDYSFGFAVASADRRKARFFLYLSVGTNLAILLIFKYYNFFATEANRALQLFGVLGGLNYYDIIVPIGISFYTFHGLSYVFDIYNNKREPERNLIDYALFVSFFPLLIAGPIERANHLLPQIKRVRTFKYIQAVDGCRLILWGIFKKVVIADGLAAIVDDIFNKQGDLQAYSLIAGAIGFSFQIYADFSGYTDIALGTAKLFGFELLTNFKFPYFSRDIAEFWRRWHISLSSWFKDYLYIPLGGSKEGRWKAVRNTFLVFLISGFWHGAEWKFVFWGGLHACFFLPLLLLKKNRRYTTEIVAQNRPLPSIREFMQMITTFILVTFAWIFFRAASLHHAYQFINRIITDSISNPVQYLSLPSNGKLIIFYIIPFLLFDWWLRRDERHVRTTRSRVLNWLIYILMLLAIFNTFLGYLVVKPGNFIYFQF